MYSCICLCLVLVLGQYWPHRMHWEEFPSLRFLGRVHVGFVLILEFLLVKLSGLRLLFFKFLTQSLVIGLFRFSISLLVTLGSFCLF